MEEVIIENIEQYIHVICEISNEIKESDPFDDKELLYRGQSSKDYELIPSLGRGRTFSCDYTIFNQERNLIEMAKYKLPDVFNNNLLPIELLALLQHYGIPTRLLDVSENPLVALYFACKRGTGKEDDGEVVIFCNKNIDVTNYPIVNAIAESYRFADSTDTYLSSFYSDIKNQPYFLEQKRRLEDINPNDSRGAEWVAECCENLIYVYAPERSLRQQIQRGRYILFPNHINSEMSKDGAFEWNIDSIPKNHPDIVKRIIIPRDKKKALLEALSVLGISEEFLFCDNADVVCKGIYEFFRKRDKKNY